MKITQYRDNLKNLDRGQLLNEVNKILDQQEQVWAGERVAVDFPEDGKDRPKWKKLTVGSAVPDKPEPRDVKYHTDGRIKSYKLDGNLVVTK